MRNGGDLFVRRCLGVAIAVGWPTMLHAQETQTGLLVSTGLSAETNPYNAANADDAAVAATAEFRPRLRLRDATTTVDVDGLAQFRQFFTRYGLEDNYGANVRAESRRSERLTFRSNLAFSYTEGGYNVFGQPGPWAMAAPIGTGQPSTDIGVITPPGVALGDPTTTPLLTDVTLLGQRTRTTLYGGGAGFDAQLGGRSRLSGDLDARALRVKSFGFSDYNSANFELRYSHDLSELTAVGVIGSIGRTNYLNSRAGDATTAAALLSLDRRFSARWALSLAAGASFTDIQQLAGQPNVHLTALNLRARFCRQDDLSQLCISLQRSPQPSANGNVRISDAVGADYSLRLSERERITLAGTYSRTGRGRGVAANLPAVEFVNASARYDNQIAERVSLFGSASFGKIYSDVVSRRANLGVAAGLQYRFGALR